MALSVREIHKMYEGKPLLRGVSFDVADGETDGEVAVPGWLKFTFGASCAPLSASKYALGSEPIIPAIIEEGILFNCVL